MQARMKGNSWASLFKGLLIWEAGWQHVINSMMYNLQPGSGGCV